MTFLLSSQNVLTYLNEKGLCEAQEQDLSQIKEKSSKNFNLLVSFSNDRHLLIKQELRDQEGKTKKSFLDEWGIHQLLQFSELSPIRLLISEAIHFDPEYSIIVYNYLDDYCDLTDFYDKEQIFPTAIATTIGANLATIHRSTIDNQEYKNFLAQSWEKQQIDRIPNLLRKLERIEPEVFGSVCLDGIQFFVLYQLYESLGSAIAILNAAFQPCCLTHNDLKLDNILLHKDFSRYQAEPSNDISRISDVRIIDWEHSRWGDPAFDLGMIIASYLKIWLSSLVINTDIDVETSLASAITPLEQVQPSIFALTKAYFQHFPEILQRRPDFLTRVMQFTGIGLINRIQAKLEYQEAFDNTGICMLQVAKTLLCRPEQSISVVFGTTAIEELVKGEREKEKG